MRSLWGFENTKKNKKKNCLEIILFFVQKKNEFSCNHRNENGVKYLILDCHKKIASRDNFLLNFTEFIIIDLNAPLSILCRNA